MAENQGTAIRYAHAPEADGTMAGDRAAVFHRGTRVAITLNPTGTILWNTLGEPRTEAELVQELQARFPQVSEEQLEGDVRSFLQELTSHQLLQTR